MWRAFSLYTYYANVRKDTPYKICVGASGCFNSYWFFAY
jgi:hypothetical protein